MDLFLHRRWHLLPGTAGRWAQGSSGGRLCGRSSPGLTKPELCGYCVDVFSRNLHKGTERISSAGLGESTVIRIQSRTDWWVPLKSLCWADLVCFALLHLKNVSGCAFVAGSTAGNHTVTASNKTSFINVLWVITKTSLQIWKNQFLFKYNKQAGFEICKTCLIISLSQCAFVHDDRYEE